MGDTHFFSVISYLVPTLCVGMPAWTLRVLQELNQRQQIGTIGQYIRVLMKEYYVSKRQKLQALNVQVSNF